MVGGGLLVDLVACEGVKVARGELHHRTRAERIVVDVVLQRARAADRHPLRAEMVAHHVVQPAARVLPRDQQTVQVDIARQRIAREVGLVQNLPASIRSVHPSRRARLHHPVAVTVVDVTLARSRQRTALRVVAPVVAKIVHRHLASSIRRHSRHLVRYADRYAQRLARARSGDLADLQQVPPGDVAVVLPWDSVIDIEETIRLWVWDLCRDSLDGKEAAFLHRAGCFRVPHKCIPYKT